MGNSPDELRDQIEATRADMTHNVDVLTDKVSPTAIAGRQLDTVKGAFGGVRDKVMGATQHSGDQLSTTGSIPCPTRRRGSAGACIGHGQRRPQRSSIEGPGQPCWPPGVIAFGAGLLLSSLLPTSEKEQQAAVALKDKAAPLVDEAKTQAGQLKDNLQPVAQGAVEEVKSTAADAVAATKDHATERRR